MYSSSSLSFIATAALLATSAIAVPAAPHADSHAQTPVPAGPVSGKPLQYIPTHTRAPGNFTDGGDPIGEPPPIFVLPKDIPAVYQARDVDLPFLRLHQGKLKLFNYTNTKDADNSVWSPKLDSADQGACGIPFNAYRRSTVAIHPYWLKYAGLDRIFRQSREDVCISFWQTKFSPTQGHPGDKDPRLLDMMLKVTDICSTDPTEPNHCATPADIKIDRVKAKIINALDHVPQGYEYPDDFQWFFMKCWDDGLVQPAYNTTKNWFTQPPLPSNSSVMQGIALQQYKNNQVEYKKRNWPLYPNGAYLQPANRSSHVQNITDWVPGKEPKWSPVAGGKQAGG